MRSVFGIIGKSPFGQLVEHTERVHETVAELRPMMEAFVAGEWMEVRALRKKIYKLEHQADLIKNGIRDNLPRSLFLPVDRGDLLLFLKEQDSIADRVEDIGDVLSMRATPTPEEMRPSILELADRVVLASDTWYRAATTLTTLQEASFGGSEAQKVLKLVDEVSHQEWEADKAEASALTTLFTFEDELGAVSVLVWMNIIELMGRVADHAENTADLLRLMMARS